MKKVSFIILLLTILTSLIAQEAEQPTSKIIIYRENNYQGSAVNYKVFINNKLVKKLKNNSYFEFNCLPGTYAIRVNDFAETRMDLTVEEGNTYYLRFGINYGFWTGVPELLVIEENQGRKAIQNRSIRKLDENPVADFRPKNRIGFTVGFGGGFERYDVFERTDGGKSTISFGGGSNIGIRYGHEFSRHFDLAIDLGYQFNQLSPVLKNAKLEFDRGFLSLTPSFIIPINDGDLMRIKLGAGPDCFFGNTLTWEARNIMEGFDDEWKYATSIGYHISGILEVSPSDRFTYSMGLKWYNTTYKFDKSSNKHPLIDSDFYKPNGAGLDFTLGIYYHF